MLSPSEYDRIRSLPNKLTASSPGVLVPFSASALEARFTWVCLAHHLPSPGIPTLLTAFFFQNLPALFRAGCAHGVPPSGRSPLAEPSSPLGRGALLALALARRVTESSALVTVCWPPRPCSLRRFVTLGHRMNRDPKAGALLGFQPFRDFPLDPAHHFRGRSSHELRR